MGLVKEPRVRSSRERAHQSAHRARPSQGGGGVDRVMQEGRKAAANDRIDVDVTSSSGLERPGAAAPQRWDVVYF